MLGMDLFGAPQTTNTEVVLLEHVLPERTMGKIFKTSRPLEPESMYKAEINGRMQYFKNVPTGGARYRNLSRSLGEERPNLIQNIGYWCNLLNETTGASAVGITLTVETDQEVIDKVLKEECCC